MVKLPELQQLDTQTGTSVIGMGTMGRRLATKFSARGAEVRRLRQQRTRRRRRRRLCPRHGRRRFQDRSRRNSRLAEFVIAPDLRSAVKDAWLVIEAVAEKPDLKTSLFGELDQLAAPAPSARHQFVFV